MALLSGTELSGTGTVASLLEELEALRARGERHARIQQLGCALVIVGVGIGVALIALKYIWAAGIEAGVVLLLYHYATSLDPELAEDERLAFLCELLSTLDPKREVTLWAELNAYDMAVADERQPTSDGRVRSQWKQPWLTLELQEDPPRTLSAWIEAEQLIDGIQVLEEHSEDHFELEKRTESFAAMPKGASIAAWLR